MPIGSYAGILNMAQLPKFDTRDPSLYLIRNSKKMAGAPNDDSAQHRLKAEACRRLADAEKDPYRKAMWMERADYWERIAAKAAKLSQQRNPQEV